MPSRDDDPRLVLNPLGRRREVGEADLVLRPGESAEAIEWASRERADGGLYYAVTRWRVFPTPGVRGWWRRLRARAFGDAP